MGGAPGPQTAQRVEEDLAVQVGALRVARSPLAGPRRGRSSGWSRPLVEVSALRAEVDVGIAGLGRREACSRWQRRHYAVVCAGDGRDEVLDRLAVDPVGAGWRRRPSASARRTGGAAYRRSGCRCSGAARPRRWPDRASRARRTGGSARAGRSPAARRRARSDRARRQSRRRSIRRPERQVALRERDGRPSRARPAPPAARRRRR